MSGYSQTPLVRKLGIKPGSRVHFRRAPEDLARHLGPLPPDVDERASLRGSFDFIHVFSDSRREIEDELPRLKSALRKTGSLWISWPKKASGKKTDLSGGEVRSLGLASGLVDIKVCAIDEVWSGLKFVYRTADR